MGTQIICNKSLRLFLLIHVHVILTCKYYSFSERSSETQRETPEHIVCECTEHRRRPAGISSARSASSQRAGFRPPHKISHDDFIAIMALDARFAPALGFLAAGSVPSFERVVMTS